MSRSIWCSFVLTVALSMLSMGCGERSGNQGTHASILEAETGPSANLIDQLRSELQDPVFLCAGGHGAGAGMTSEEACALVKRERDKLQNLIREIDFGAIIIP